MPAEQNVCISCRRPGAAIVCQLCEEPLCKGCAECLDSSTFSYLERIPQELSHTFYCGACFTATVEAALDSYNEIMERARNVYFFFDRRRGGLPLLKRSEDKIQVEACPDRDETILRLAFRAAEMGYNAIVDARVTSEKLRDAGYQKSRWSGLGVPAQVDAEKLERQSDRR